MLETVEIIGYVTCLAKSFLFSSKGFGFLDIEDPGSVVEEKPETHVEDMRKLERRIQQDHKLLQQKMLKEHPQPQYSKWGAVLF